MRLILLSVILFTGWLRHESATAQPGDASVIIQQINSNLEMIRQGVFELNIQFKSAPIDDTATFSGKVYFFKNYDDPYGLAHFIFYQEDNPICVYDDGFLYQIFHEKKTIQMAYTASNHPLEFVQGALFLNLGLFKPYLKIEGPAFDVSKFEFYKTDTLPKRQTIHLSQIETYFNDLKITPYDPDTGRHIIHYEISLPDYTLHSITEWDYFMQTPQYQRIEFSAIRPLPKDSTLKDIIRWMDLFDSGYKVKFYEPDTTEEYRAGDQSLIPGTILPGFALPNLDGTLVQSENLSQGILLLDFWYRACFPCLKAMPALEKLHQKYSAKGLTVIGINPFDKNAEKLKTFLKDRQINYPTLIDNERQFAEQIAIDIYPTLLLVDAATKEVLHVETGFGEETEPELAQRIEALLHK